MVNPLETILPVDDEEIVRRNGSRALERHGLEVLCATSGIDALAAAEQHAGPALLLTDVMMPGMSGCDLAAGTFAPAVHTRLAVRRGRWHS